ncbi:MAG: cobyrinate a,c-diamide synthase [Lentisphaeria bacterium]|nr:cobyrinate a,c-diamide synthase [Lentisphaeria bacterium]
MSDNKTFSRFMIAGTNSGSGKTTFSLAVLRALKRRGLSVAPFKCGPDYIDPLFHRQAAGATSWNLDTFFGSETEFSRRAAGHDAAVVEGVMGLFDGIHPDRLDGSCAEIAAKLRLPVVLTVNAQGISGSIAPLVKGFAEWHPGVKIIGVFAAKVGSARHAELLKTALAAAGLPPLLGYLVRDDRLILPERHLGLSVGKLDDAWLDSLAAEFEAGADLDLLLELSRGPVSAVRPETFPPPVLRLGVAQDEAFCFYYEANLDALRRNGVEIVPFSPLHDRVLPENLNGIYLGGGYPELYLKELNANVSMLDSIRDFAKDHFVYGECGGYLFLLESLEDFSGQTLPCLGLLPGRARMNRRLASLGYREVSGEWGRGRGHEFHYSSLIEPPPGPYLWHGADKHGREFDCGGIRGKVCGSYIHLYFAGSPELIRGFIDRLAN